MHHATYAAIPNRGRPGLSHCAIHWFMAAGISVRRVARGSSFCRNQPPTTLHTSAAMSELPDLAALIATRYGAGPATSTSTSAAASSLSSLPDSPALKTMLAHKSVRHFAADTPLPAGALDVIIAAAQSAPSSCNLQTWSVVAVQDAGRKAQLATLSGGQDWIQQAPLFLVFVADLHRLGAVAAKEEQPPGASLAYTEMFLMASLDAAFAAQNAVVAAEALGLGCCYVGAARNRPREVAALLGLPDRAVGIFGLALGVPRPDGTIEVKPRLPAAEVLHYERWDDGAQNQHLETYNQAIDAFNVRQKRPQKPAWTAQSTLRTATEEGMEGRHKLRPFLHERGFELQ